MVNKKFSLRIAVFALLFTILIIGCPNDTPDDSSSTVRQRDSPFDATWWACVPSLEDPEITIWSRMTFNNALSESPPVRVTLLRDSFRNFVWGDPPLDVGEHIEGTYTYSGNTATISLDGTTESITIGANDTFTWQGIVFKRTLKLSGTITISPPNPTKGQPFTATYNGSEPVIYSWGAYLPDNSPIPLDDGRAKTQKADQYSNYYLTVSALGYYELSTIVRVQPPKPTSLAANASYAQTVAKLDAIIEYCKFNPGLINDSLRDFTVSRKTAIELIPEAGWSGETQENHIDWINTQIINQLQ